MRFAEIVNKLNKEVSAALDDPKMKAPSRCNLSH